MDGERWELSVFIHLDCSLLKWMSQIWQSVSPSKRLFCFFQSGTWNMKHNLHPPGETSSADWSSTRVLTRVAPREAVNHPDRHRAHGTDSNEESHDQEGACSLGSCQRCSEIICLQVRVKSLVTMCATWVWSKTKSKTQTSILFLVTWNIRLPASAVQLPTFNGSLKERTYHRRIPKSCAVFFVLLTIQMNFLSMILCTVSNHQLWHQRGKHP